MNILIEMVSSFCLILFYFTSCLGLLLGGGLIWNPILIIRFESLLTRRITCFSDREKSIENEISLNSHRSLEHIFFNHHLITGIALVILPMILLYLLRVVPLISEKEALGFLTSDWELFYRLILLPSVILFIKLTGCFSMLWGLLILFLPEVAFLWLRILNRSFSSSMDLKVIERYPRVIGGLLMVASIFLMILLLKGN